MTARSVGHVATVVDDARVAGDDPWRQATGAIGDRHAAAHRPAAVRSLHVRADARAVTFTMLLVAGVSCSRWRASSMIVAAMARTREQIIRSGCRRCSSLAALGGCWWPFSSSRRGCRSLPRRDDDVVDVRHPRRHATRQDSAGRRAEALVPDRLWWRVVPDRSALFRYTEN